MKLKMLKSFFSLSLNVLEVPKVLLVSKYPLPCFFLHHC